MSKPSLGFIRLRVRELLLRHVFPAGLFRLHQSKHADAQRASSENLIVICLWNRHIRFKDLLTDLGSQDIAGGVTLGLWNNDIKLREYYESALAEWLEANPGSALRDIYITHSPINAGGIGRFYLAKRLSRRLSTNRAIFLDDDQKVPTDFASKSFAQFNGRTIASWWGWRITDNDYWNRERALPGEHVDYAGTGGMVLDTRVLELPTLYRNLKREAWFLEDIWLSHVALENGFSLIALDADITFVLEETNQHHRLAPMKPEFYRELAEERTSSRKKP